MKVRANKKIITFAIAFGTAVLLSACDDEITQISNPDRQTAESLDALSECNEKNEGDIAYVKDVGELYLCADSEWKKMVASDKVEGHDGANGKDGKNGADGKDGKNGSYCTVSALKDSSGYDILCDGEKVGTLLNGKDGAKGDEGDKGVDGDKGADGDAGADCSAKALTDGSGFELSCGGKVVGSIHNGQNGSNGDNGADCSGKVLENGAGIELTCGDKIVGTLQNGENAAEAKDCEAIDDGRGEVKISCSRGSTRILYTYKAMCGTTVYDPEKKVCLRVVKDGNQIEATLAPLCNGKPYNPYEVGTKRDDEKSVVDLLNADSRQMCKEGVVVSVCGNENAEYDPDTQECNNGHVVNRPRCGNEVYDPKKFMCDTRDGHLYKITTITIPEKNYSQTWMAENLNYATEVWGTDSNSFCYGDNGSTDRGGENCATYGRLYTWAAAIDSVKLATDPENPTVCGNEALYCSLPKKLQGVCPNGWHLPSYEEWSALITAVGGENSAGGVLKAQSGWRDYNGTDDFGFNALPAGYGGLVCYNEKCPRFDYIGLQARFWSSTIKSDNVHPDEMYMYDYNYIAYLNWTAAYYALSVRCIKG